VISSRSLEGRRAERCAVGMLISLGLLSARGLSWLSSSAVHDFFRGSYFGMRLMLVRRFEEVLFEKDGSDGTGDPDDRGCETQSSERESSHAWSIVTRLVLLKILRVIRSSSSCPRFL